MKTILFFGILFLSLVKTQAVEKSIYINYLNIKSVSIEPYTYKNTHPDPRIKGDYKALRLIIEFNGNDKTQRVAGIITGKQFNSWSDYCYKAEDLRNLTARQFNERHNARNRYDGVSCKYYKNFNLKIDTAAVSHIPATNIIGSLSGIVKFIDRMIANQSQPFGEGLEIIPQLYISYISNEDDDIHQLKRLELEWFSRNI
jgi:hypothetical protein